MNNKIISKVVSGTLLFSMVGYTLPVLGYTKDETVYSKLDASGKNYETIVSTHIKNTEDEEIIRDLSDLLNVKIQVVMKHIHKMVQHLNGKQIKMIYIIKEIQIKNYQYLVK